MTIESVREAVARGWCATGQAHKVMDASLAEAIAQEVHKSETAGVRGVRAAIEVALNGASAESGSNTPDFILATYLTSCLKAFDEATRAREKWYGCEHFPGKRSTALEP